MEECWASINKECGFDLLYEKCHDVFNKTDLKKGKYALLLQDLKTQTEKQLKGQLTPKSKSHIFPLT